MFQRQKKLSFWENTRQIFWPKMGMWRLLKYYLIRVPRLTDSAHSIAINLAAGAVMSFTPFFGVHILGAMGIAKILCGKINIIAALVGTFFGNPWTTPFLMYSSYTVGVLVLSYFTGHQTSINFDPTIAEQKGESIFIFLWDNFAALFLPAAVGSAIIAVVSFPFFYVIFFNLVKAGQTARKIRLKHKQKALFNKKSHGDDYP